MQVRARYRKKAEGQEKGRREVIEIEIIIKMNKQDSGKIEAEETSRE